LNDTLICPHCQEKLWVAQMQIPLLTCPRCLGLIVNPNAAAEKPPPPLPGAQRRVEPRMVIPIEEEADYDLRGTVVGLVLLALVILGGEWAVLFVLRQTALSVVLIGAAMIFPSNFLSPFTTRSAPMSSFALRSMSFCNVWLNESKATTAAIPVTSEAAKSKRREKL